VRLTAARHEQQDEVYLAPTRTLNCLANALHLRNGGSRVIVGGAHHRRGDDPRPRRGLQDEPASAVPRCLRHAGNVVCVPWQRAPEFPHDFHHIMPWDFLVSVQVLLLLPCCCSLVD
jgi:hypothetical protein